MNTWVCNLRDRILIAAGHPVVPVVVLGLLVIVSRGWSRVLAVTVLSLMLVSKVASRRTSPAEGAVRAPAGPLEVWLEAPGPHRLQVANVVRALTGSNLLTAWQLVAAAAHRPVQVRDGLLVLNAERAVGALRRAGGTASVRSTVVLPSSGASSGIEWNSQ